MVAEDDSTGLAALLLRISHGDRSAFAQFYVATAPCAYALAKELLPTPEADGALLERAYLRVWECAGEYRPSLGSPRAWLIGLVRRMALTEMRSSATVKPEHAELLQMIYFDGLTYRDIAERLGLPAETVRARIHESLGLLGVDQR